MKYGHEGFILLGGLTKQLRSCGILVVKEHLLMLQKVE